VYGVDFSAAAADAGTKTWIASGTAADGELVVADVAPLVEVLGLDTADRETALPALAAWIRGRDDDAVVGLDLPFGLPRFVVAETGTESWRSFINGFPESIGVDGSGRGTDSGSGRGTDGRDAGDGNAEIGDDGSAETDDPVRAFAERCVALTERHGEGTYDKRQTDAAVGARSPYGFIADTIAFYGMRDVLAPVLDAVRVAPMDLTAQTDPAAPTDPTDGRWRPEVPPGPTLVETYPAAVLDRLGLRRTIYKGGGDEETTRRRRNVTELAAEADISYNHEAELVDAVVADAGGDALDAVVACVGAFTAWDRDYEPDIAGFDDPDAVAVEGYIYA